MKSGFTRRVGGQHRGSATALALAGIALSSGVAAATFLNASDRQAVNAQHPARVDRESLDTKLQPTPVAVRQTRNVSATIELLQPEQDNSEGGIAGSCPTQVDTYSQADFSGGSFVMQAGFVEQEIAAAEFAVPASDFPLVLNVTEMIFAQQNTISATTTEWSLMVWEGNPETGTLIEVFSSDDVILPHLSMAPGTQGANVQVQVDPGDPDQIVINANPSNSFTVGFRIDKHNNPPTTSCECISGCPGCGTLPAVCCPPPTNSNAFPTTDPNDGGSPTAPSKNWLYARDCPGTTGLCSLAVAEGWHQFSDLGASSPSGDWNIRVTYTPLSCDLSFGACCQPFVGCVVMSNFDCADASGDYQGANTTCAQADCGYGGCCFPEGGCLVMTESECDEQQSTYAGDGTTCGPNACTQNGACCVPTTGQCASGVDEATCGAVDGIWQGAGSDCNSITCFPQGACCMPDGGCAGPVSPEDCAAAGGTFHGDGTSCDSVSCPQPSGACCLPNGNCVSATSANCTAFGGEWQNMGTNCSDGNGNGQADACEDPAPRCPADLTGDESVGVPDLLVLLGAWGDCAPSCPADLNGDGSVGVPDLLDLLGAWGDCE